MRGLEGRRILVAGSGTGIGTAAARRLIEEGARIHLGGAEPQLTALAGELSAAGDTVTTSVFDLTDPASAAAMVTDAVASLGGLDGVVNTGADLSPETMGNDVAVIDMDVEIWERTLRANLVSNALVVKHTLPHLVAAGGGAIVTTTSDTAWNGEDSRPAYAASKAALNALTRHVATTYGKDGVRANAVGHGHLVPRAVQATMNPDAMDALLEDLTVTRLGEPEDVARTICYLLSDDASWVSGQVWTVNGGAGFRD